jgi:hypothetical protein
MPLPSELLQAVSSPGGGRMALVLGAGCSVEHPTGIQVSTICSLEIHRLLVADGILEDDECAKPEDLSAVADAVFKKHGSQRAVVERLRDSYDMKLGLHRYRWMTRSSKPSGKLFRPRSGSQRIGSTGGRRGFCHNTFLGPSLTGASARIRSQRFAMEERKGEILEDLLV